jgi:hypothetical protein
MILFFSNHPKADAYGFSMDFNIAQQWLKARYILLLYCGLGTLIVAPWLSI